MENNNCDYDYSEKEPLYRASKRRKVGDSYGATNNPTPKKSYLKKCRDYLQAIWNIIYRIIT